MNNSRKSELSSWCWDWHYLFVLLLFHLQNEDNDTSISLKHLQIFGWEVLAMFRKWHFLTFQKPFQASTEETKKKGEKKKSIQLFVQPFRAFSVTRPVTCLTEMTHRRWWAGPFAALGLAAEQEKVGIFASPPALILPRSECNVLHLESEVCVGLS